MKQIELEYLKLYDRNEVINECNVFDNIPTLTVDFLRSLILYWFSRIMQKSFSLGSVSSRQKLR